MVMEAGRVLIRPGEGAELALGGLGIINKLSGEDTNGGFAIVEHPIAPGALAAPPHTHSIEDEYSLVLEGEIGVRIGGDEFRATPGTYVLKPRGVPHTFWNAGEEPARILEIISPAGFESYFGEVAAVLSTGGEADFGKIMEIAGRYGLTMHMEQVPELLERHGLTFE